MGDWMIIIKGSGQYHNQNPKDADVELRAFVDKLKADGQTIQKALFVTGGYNIEKVEG